MVHCQLHAARAAVSAGRDACSHCRRAPPRGRGHTGGCSLHSLPLLPLLPSLLCPPSLPSLQTGGRSLYSLPLLP
jgi:hypothetical protein